MMTDSDMGHPQTATHEYRTAKLAPPKRLLPAKRLRPAAQRYPPKRQRPAAQRYPPQRQWPTAQRYPPPRAVPFLQRALSPRAVHWIGMSEVIYGIHSIGEALKRGGRRFDYVAVSRDRTDNRLQSILDDCRAQGITVRFVPREDIDRETRTNTHQGVMAIEDTGQPQAIAPR